jgi:hypothetical protein
MHPSCFPGFDGGQTGACAFASGSSSTGHDDCKFGEEMIKAGFQKELLRACGLCHAL